MLRRYTKGEDERKGKKKEEEKMNT